MLSYALLLESTGATSVGCESEGAEDDGSMTVMKSQTYDVRGWVLLASFTWHLYRSLQTLHIGVGVPVFSCTVSMGKLTCSNAWSGLLGLHSSLAVRLLTMYTTWTWNLTLGTHMRAMFTHSACNILDFQLSMKVARRTLASLIASP